MRLDMPDRQHETFGQPRTDDFDPKRPASDGLLGGRLETSPHRAAARDGAASEELKTMATVVGRGMDQGVVCSGPRLVQDSLLLHRRFDGMSAFLG
jgi:hypothetical protein